ncbi:hypothetical protein HKX48_005864 [Thoreauomyces humboldtii]|nr:hypothetical protein HKX48_005864 [Thoreauomyces humboldtii]
MMGMRSCQRLCRHFPKSPSPSIGIRIPVAAFSTSFRPREQQRPPTSNLPTAPTDTPTSPSAPDGGPARMVIGFTCKECDHRQHKYMSKKAYTTGVVIIRCDGCDALHLIADHLGWFDSQQPPGTIEDILRRKGEGVVKGSIGSFGSGDNPAGLAKRYEARQAGGEGGTANGPLVTETDQGMIEILPDVK